MTRKHASFWSTVSLLALVACSHGTSPPSPSPPGTTAQTLGQYAHTADAIADARLQALHFETGTDGMNGTLVWTVVQCHAGDCRPGQEVRTRFASPPFATQGDFCNVRRCLERSHLSDYVGSTFLVTFARGPYELQTEGTGGVPHDDATSLNRGYYLKHRGDLYANDPHQRIDARYDATLAAMLQ